MSVFRKLAGETALYGLSSIVARVVNFLLVPLHTLVLNRSDYGVVGQLYGWVALLFVLYTFRLEAAYFRYATNDSKSTAYANSKVFTLIFALSLSIVATIWSSTIAGWLQVEGQSHLIKFVAAIVALDAICELPFAKLRLEKRPLKFVYIRCVNVGINVLLNIYFLLIHPGHQSVASADLLIYIFIANLVASAVTLALLAKEYLAEGFKFHTIELKKILQYSWPLLIVGLAAVINDAMTRQFLGWWAPGSMMDKKNMMGEYNACVKFAVFISLFIQAFRYAAEPFFFKHMHTADAKSDYSKITTYFTQFMMIGFVVILLYLDFIKNIVVTNPDYFRAIGVVPIVLMANVFLGIFYNVSNWYRLTDRTRYGMYAALIGVGLTILFNILLVPRYSYYGTAWAMLICYTGMAVATYLWGQKYYPVPFDFRKITGVVLGGVLIYFSSIYFDRFVEDSLLIRFSIHTLFLAIYLIVFNKELLKTFIRPLWVQKKNKS